MITIEVLPKRVNRICHHGHMREQNPCSKRARVLWSGTPYCKRHAQEMLRLLSPGDDEPCVADTQVAPPRLIQDA